MGVFTDSKEVLQLRINQAVEQRLLPGETVIVHGLAVEGPTPILTAFGGSELDYRQYFVALTDRRLVFIRSSQWSNKAKRKAYAVERSTMRSVRWKRRWGWTTLLIEWPNARRPLRLHFNRLWRDEAAKIAAELRAG